MFFGSASSQPAVPFSLTFAPAGSTHSWRLSVLDLCQGLSFCRHGADKRRLQKTAPSFTVFPQTDLSSRPARQIYDNLGQAFLGFVSALGSCWCMRTRDALTRFLCAFSPMIRCRQPWRGQRLVGLSVLAPNNSFKPKPLRGSA